MGTLGWSFTGELHWEALWHCALCGCGEVAKQQEEAELISTLGETVSIATAPF